jgi:hypothetical protein
MAVLRLVPSQLPLQLHHLVQKVQHEAICEHEQQKDMSEKCVRAGQCRLQTRKNHNPAGDGLPLVQLSDLYTTRQRQRQQDFPTCTCSALSLSLSRTCFLDSSTLRCETLSRAQRSL